MIKFKIFPCF